ncbi:MAG: site-2 protease family protein [bacterium]
MQVDLIFQIAILIMSVVIHEVSHGYVAYSLGDPTAKLAGRLTLNPLKHLDPFGSFILPLLMTLAGLPAFGWARPVPYNPYNLKAGNWGPALVAIAGPGSNILVAVILSFLLRYGGVLGLSQAFFQLTGIAILINIFLALFNLIPLPPLDGSKILYALLPYRWRWIEEALERYSLIIIIIVVYGLARFLEPIAIYFFKLLTGVAIF